MLLQYGPSIVANMDPSERDQLPPHLRDLFLNMHETRTKCSEDLKTSHKTVVWDSGASISVSFDRDDFVGPITPVPTSMRLRGIMRRIKIHGQGHVAWSFVDTTGMLRTLKVPALYIPSAKARLLSTTSLLQAHPSETIQLTEDRLLLSGCGSNDPPTNPIEVLIDVETNLPTSLAMDYNNSFSFNVHNVTTVSPSNANLTEPEKELLRWHYHLGHLGWRKIQLVMRSGVLSNAESKRRLHTQCCKLKECPRCAACLFAKQSVRPSGARRTTIVQDSADALSRECLLPGQRISIDHFVCSTKGRLFSSRGRTAESDLYSGGCLFVDHASGHVDVEFQAHLNSTETLQAKERFELCCRDVRVFPQEYLTDAGTAFTSSSFTAHLGTFHQHSRTSGPGAHHQNGRAERAIRTITSIARAMLLHSAIHWSDVANASLWPMAVQHAVYIWNHMPSTDTGLSPLDLFTRTRWPLSKLQDLHVWGCPVYVLNKKLADGQKLPRWTPRS